jgi:hypothetical protein
MVMDMDMVTLMEREKNKVISLETKTMQFSQQVSPLKP